MTGPARGPRGTWQHLCWWRGQGSLDTERTLHGLPRDDLSAAMLLEDEYAGEIHRLAGSGTWHIWDGRCHAPDDGDRISRIVAGLAYRAAAALEQCRLEITREHLRAAGAENEAAGQAAADREWQRWEQPAKYLAGLRRSAGAGSLLKYLGTITSCPDKVMDERHPEWLNFANGTVNLSTLQAKPHDPADMLAYCLETAWNPAARCPRFLALARTVCGGDEDVLWYLIRLLGYALLGDNRAQKIVFISGPSGSGKTALLSVLSRLLGPLAHESQAQLVTLARHGRNARTENSVRGRRLVTITETSAFMTIDEGQLKRITGESVISVDQHYARTEIETPVTWLIVVATNQMPSLVNFDDAMRRRVIVIPGGQPVPAHLQADRLAEQVAAEEAEGILALLAKACAQYWRQGLAMPLAVQIATDAYAGEQNTVADFLADCCLRSPGSAIAQHDLHLQYQKWARGGHQLGRRTFYDHMRMQPGISHNEVMRRFEGITWNARMLSGTI